MIAGLAGVVLLVLGGAWGVREHEATDPVFGTEPRVWRPLVVSECYELTYTDPVGGAEPRVFPGWLTLKPGAGRTDQGPVLSEAHPTDSIRLSSMFPAGWRRRDDDLLEISIPVGDGLSGIGILAARRDSTLEGRASSGSDLPSPGPTPSMRLAGRRRECPVPASPAG